MYDFCVIGSGPSAISVVKSLNDGSRKSAKILWIEANRELFGQREYTSLYPRFVSQKSGLDPTINIGRGGTSELWHAVLAPFDPIDFEERSWIPNSGWPISFDDIRSDYKAACSLFGFEFDIFDTLESKWKSEADSRDFCANDAFFSGKPFVQLSPIWRGSREVSSICEAPNITYLSGIAALGFFLDRKDRKLIRCGDYKSGNVFEFMANQYVLSAGALNTPRILLNSEESMFENQNIGRYLMDHPMGNHGQLISDNPISMSIFSGVGFNSALKYKFAYRLNELTQRQMSMPNSVFYPRASFSIGSDNKTEELKLQLLTMRREILGGKIPFSALLDVLGNPNLTRQILSYKFGLFETSKIIDFFHVSEQTPNFDSCVKLSNESVDRFGYREHEVLWKLSNYDFAAHDDFLSLVVNSTSKDFGLKPAYDLSDVSWRSRLSSAAHHVGTCRMSTCDENGVVSPLGKVFGHDDVSIADGSIFPTSGNANITLTVTALANRIGSILTHG